MDCRTHKCAVAAIINFDKASTCHCRVFRVFIKKIKEKIFHVVELSLSELVMYVYLFFLWAHYPVHRG